MTATLCSAPSLSALQEEPTRLKELQTTQSGQEAESTSEVFIIHHADVHSLGQLLQVFGVQIKAQPSMRTIAVTGDRATVESVRQAIRRLDVAPKNVELTVYLLLASRSSVASAYPEELGRIVAQLEETFGYKGYTLLDALLLRTRAGARAGSSIRGFIPAGSTGTSIGYRFSARSIRVTSGTQEESRVGAEEIGVSIVRPQRAEEPRPIVEAPDDQVEAKDEQVYEIADSSSERLSLGTSLDLQEGETVLLGKANMDEEGNSLVVAISARILN